MFPLSRAQARRARRAADHEITGPEGSDVDVLAEQFGGAMRVDGKAEDIADLLARISIGCGADDEGPRLYSDFDGAERAITDEVGLFAAIAALVASGRPLEFWTVPRGDTSVPARRRRRRSPSPEEAPPLRVTTRPANKAMRRDDSVVGLSVSTDGLIVARGDLLKQLSSGRRVIARVHHTPTKRVAAAPITLH